MSEISPQIVDATWREIAAISDARGRREMKRLGQEQPDLLAYVLESTEDLSPPVHAVGVYVFVVIWQVFRRATPPRLPRVKAAAIERRMEETADWFAKLEGADVRFLERAAQVQISAQPHVFQYMVEAIMEAPDDPEDPVPMTPEESGRLFLTLGTAIHVLNEARERTS